MAKNGSPNLRKTKIFAALYTIGLCAVSLVIYGTLFSRTCPPISAKDDPAAERDPNAAASSNTSAADEDSMTYKTYKDQHQIAATVLLDAGHGGIDGGNVTNDVLEKDLNLSITNKVAQYLKELNPNIDVRLTRPTDETPWFTDVETDLNYRQEQQKAQNADYFFSIHCNTLPEDPTVEGMIFFVNPTDTVMKDLANKIGENLTSIGWTQNYNIIDDQLYQVVTMSDIHSTLVELGFMTNEFDFQKLTDPVQQDKAAKAIAAAISDYIMENPDAPEYVKPSEQNSEVSSAQPASIESNAAESSSQSQQPAADPNASQNSEAAQDPNAQPAQ